MSTFGCVYVPFVGVVKGLYMFPLLLAVVAVIVVLMPLLVTFQLSNLGFDGPSKVCTVGPVIVRGIIGSIECLDLRQ